MNPTFAKALGVERLSVVTLKPVETKAVRSPVASKNSLVRFASVRGKVAAR